MRSITPPNALRWLPSLTSCLWLLSCAVTPPDVPAFEWLRYRVISDSVTGHQILKPSDACMKAIQEAECLHGVRIVSKKEIFVGEKKEHYFNGKPMSQLIRESVLLPAAESYAPISQYIINSCKASGCSDQVDRFRVVLPTIDGLIGAAKNP